MINRLISSILSMIMLASSLFSGIIPVSDALRIVVPEDWELCVGDSRTLECVFSERITDRALVWEAEPESVASVDKWGRVTAMQTGKATITAKGNGFSDSVELNVVETPTLMADNSVRKIVFENGINEVNNLQKFVDRYPASSEQIPDFVKNADYEKCQKAVTADGAVWEITDYGVLRTDKNAPTQRDVEQRFMGNRYFYSQDTTSGKVLAILPDGENGIWTVMEKGVTHIKMIEVNGTFKANYMSANTQEYVARNGFVNEAHFQNGEWVGVDSDNDGLWTSMYSVGELLRYETLKNDPNADAEDIEEAKKAAYSSAEAVLLLYYISRRTGTTEAYVRRQTTKNIPGTTEDRWLSAEALEKGGDPSVMIPAKSPATLFDEAMASYTFFTSASRLENEGFYLPTSPDDWSDPAVTDAEYETQTRLIEGLPARTYIFKKDGLYLTDNIYWSMNADGTATGFSDKSEGTSGYLLNNENLRGVTVDASGEIPERLRNDLIGDEYSPEDIIYKTDTSADELIGHMFLFKIINDTIAKEDPEIKALLVEAVDSLAQHISDNSYMLVDATGQPTTWANFGRTLFCTGSSVAETSLHALVLLSIFKTAAYITGYQKWENEYRMAALDPAYEYARIASQHYERMMAAVKYTVGNATVHLLGNVVGTLKSTDLVEMLYRFILNYSSEELATLAFYTMFSLEDDEELLNYYRQAVDDWWFSMRYSENPLWYIIYQLAYPEKEIKDAYGNDIVETAVWSLSRHPVDTVSYYASNLSRDDIGQIDLTAIAPNLRERLTYNKKTSIRITPLEENPEILDIVKYVLTAPKVDWAVAPPDERTLYKYNTSSYYLELFSNPYCMQGSTTYTLPYWMGVYHGVILR